ncbi:MAG: PocR ligand-binding domain-containing protein [Deltaproteobacteria bacterium]|nr:PocR ligand-binding domain-containing protein [Deltaproteobacteria bacterium]
MQLERTLGLADLVEPSALHDVCTAFRELFGIGLRVFAADGSLLAESVEEEAFCTYVREFGEGRRQCNQFRAQLARFTAQGPEPLAVRCFAGCAYLAAPVLFEGDAMGKVVYGPYLPADATRLPSTLMRLDTEIDPATISERSASLRRVRHDTLDRIVHAFQRVLDLILHSGQRATLTSETHLATIEESYREIAVKNKRLQETADRLKELDRLKSNFLATVSHELRTPLTSIIGYSEMLAQGLAGPLAEEQRKFIGTILEKGEHLLRLISAVLDISTLDARRLELRREPTDVAGLCARAVEKAVAQSGRRDVRLDMRPAPALPLVPVDPDLIEKALLHLVDNALKFSPPGGAVAIELGLTEPRADGEASIGFVLLAPLRRFLRVTVRDAGPGIPQNSLDRIFDAFFQEDGSATRSHGGLGLGLALVRQFAEAHGGSVEVESEPGKGSAFHLLLPVPPSAVIPTGAPP